MIDRDHMSDLRSWGDHGLGERIAAEDGLIVDLVELLRDRVPFDNWPNATKAALVRALSYQGSSDVEQLKAEHLRRHLFPDVRSPEADISLATERSAERIRADLSDLVPFGSGLFILSDLEA
jgi:hypothetical protein